MLNKKSKKQKELIPKKKSKKQKELISNKKVTKKRMTGGSNYFQRITGAIKDGYDKTKTKYKDIKLKTKKKYKDIKIESQKNFNYLASSNPITIYWKYHNNNCFAGTVVKHLPRCKSLIIDYDFGMLIFSIINYIYEGKQKDIDFNSILKKYVDEYMGKLNISNSRSIIRVDSSDWSMDSNNEIESVTGDAESVYSNTSDRATIDGNADSSESTTIESKVDLSSIEQKVVHKHINIYDQLINVVKKKHSKYSDDYLNYYLIYQHEKNNNNQFIEIKHNIKTFENEFPASVAQIQNN